MRKQEKIKSESQSISLANNSGTPKVPLFEILAQTAKLHPNQTAITYLEKNITYLELDLLSDQFAASLKKLGIMKNDRVAIFLPNNPQFIIAYYGILKAGAVVTAINPLHREREVEHQLADSEAKVIITLDSFYPIIENVRQKTNLKTTIITRADEYADKPVNISIKTGNIDVCAFKELLKTDTSPARVNLDPDKDLAALQYTGGTTGVTKAAMLTHSNLIANAEAFATWIKGATAKEVFLTVLPLSHIYGLTTSLNVPVVLAAKIVLLSRFDPVKAFNAIQRHKVTVFCGVPTMYQTLLDHPEQQKFCLSSLRVCISGASPLPVQLQKRFIQSTGELLIEGYGLTEASPVTHCNPVDESLRTVNMGSIGLPLSGTEAKIVDAETGTKTLLAGEVGELVVRGPQVMQGYWKNPKETALVLRDGWLYTGDLARANVNGYFYLTDRKKDLIKHNGYSIYPREIEDLLYEHPAVKLCAVIGKPELSSGEVPQAFVVLKQGIQTSEQELKDFVNQKIAPYKALREIKFRQDLPLGSSGKILKRLLKEQEMRP
jgi:long-chain acyl-CoA synthetase